MKRQKKSGNVRVLLGLLVILLALIGQTATAEEAAVVASGTCGINVNWTLDERGVLTISGEGKMTSIPGLSAQPWYSMRASIQMVEIKEGVTGDGNFLFAGCSNLTSVTIRSGLTGIGNNAFSGCSSLKDVNIPNSVTYIGTRAFEECDMLRYITIPGSVTFIDTYAFYDCDKLADITIPGSAEFIGVYAFRNCDSLRNVVLHNGVEQIGDCSFYACPQLMNVTIPESVTRIGESAFERCSALANIYIPDSVTSVGDGAFKDTACTTVVFTGMDMPQMGTNVFSGNPKIYCDVNSAAVSWAQEMGYEAIGRDEPSIPLSLTLPDDFRMPLTEGKTVLPSIFPQTNAAAVEWSSSNPEIVSVESGKLTANASGQATITAVYGELFDTVTVTVYEEIVSFEIAPAEVWIAKSETLQMRIEHVLPAAATGEFSWNCSDQRKCIVDTNGMITALAGGDAILRVKADSGVFRECIVHVYYPVTAIEFEPVADELRVGETIQLAANVTARTQSVVNKLVTFSSSNERVATVDENGVVTAQASGTVTITAAATSGVTATCTLAVREWNTLILPDETKSIEQEAFLNTDAEKIIIPSGCESIGKLAFAQNEKLAFVFMPDTVNEIADDAFDGCEQLCFVCESGNYAADYAESKGIAWKVQ